MGVVQLINNVALVQFHNKVIPLYIHTYLFFIKFFSQLGYYITLSRVPCAIQKVLAGCPFKHGSGGSVHVALFPQACFAHPFVPHLVCSQEPPPHGSPVLSPPFPPLQDFTPFISGLQEGQDHNSTALLASLLQNDCLEEWVKLPRFMEQ